MPTWWRYNITTHIFEHSINEGDTWTPPPLNASIINEGIFDKARIPIVEGTFAPTLTFGGTPVTLAGTPVGYYAKVGRLTTIDVAMTVGAKAGTGQAVIGGLPFPTITGNYPAINCSWYSAFNAGVTGICGFIDANLIYLFKLAPGSAAPLTDADYNAGSDIVLSATYNATT